MREANVRGTEIVMPQFAESVVTATIGKWLKKPGDAIEEYEAICEVITDKVTAELPSTIAGVLREILVGEGTEVQVGAPICIVDQTAGAAVDEGAKAPAGGEAAVGSAESVDLRQRLSPAVRRLADEHRIDLRQLRGSGLGGRITRKDVMRYLESGERGAVPNAERTAARAPEEPVEHDVRKEGNGAKIQVRSTGLHLSESPRIPTIDVHSEHQGTGEYFVDITPIRNTIASRMRQSVTEIPHAWTMIEVDVTHLVVLRNKLKNDFYKQEGINLTYLAFLIKAVVSAIKDYPIMNSVWAIDKIIVKRDINISLAVGTEDSVITPVIKKADQKSIAGLAREIEQLALKTRTGKLTPEDLQGGTFTVNNTGSFGSILSFPIINYPQAAILTFESIVKKPVVIQDMIAVRSMVNLCLSLDHRILDGVICGRFLQRVKENLESYGPDTKLY